MNTARANRENGAGNIYIGLGDSQLSLMDSHQARPEPVHTVCPKPPLKRPPSREEHPRQRLVKTIHSQRIISGKIGSFMGLSEMIKENL
ncbi:hypothetical protein AtEden1_Chr2g0241971 [Arabidopsis thaliana]